MRNGLMMEILNLVHCLFEIEIRFFSKFVWIISSIPDTNLLKILILYCYPLVNWSILISVLMLWSPFSDWVLFKGAKEKVSDWFILRVPRFEIPLWFGIFICSFSYYFWSLFFLYLTVGSVFHLNSLANKSFLSRGFTSFFRFSMIYRLSLSSS